MILFKTTEEFTQYIPVDVNMNFDLLKPSIEEAEQLYLKDLLGEYYPILLEDYTDNNDVEAGINTMTADNQLLLPYVQRSLAYYAAFLMVEHIGVMVGSAGIQQVIGRDSQPAPRWKIRDLQIKYINSGDRFADRLLEYLENHASETVYQEWFEDENANTAISGVIVHSTTIASKYVDINDSRRVFLRMKKRIKDIEANQIKSLICGDQYEALLADLNGSPESIALKTKLEPLIAKKALYLTLPQIRVNITNDGLHLLSSAESTVKQDHATHEDIKMLMHDLREGEFGYLADEDTVRKFIQDNISDYPLISASDCYTETAVPRKWVADNDKLNKHFSV